MSTPALPVWYGCSGGGAISLSPDNTAKTALQITADAAKSAGGILGAISAASFTAAIPGIGAAVLGLTSLGFAIANVFSGCGSTCTQATTYANAAEDRLNQVINTYFSTKVRTRSLQVGTLTIIVGTFQALCAACSQPALGDAGQRCISERLVQGSSAPWCPTGTGCDWVTAYYLPVLNDSGVIPDPTTPPASAPGAARIPAPTAPTAPSSVSVAASAPPAPADNSMAYILVGAVALLAIIRYKH